MVCETGYYIRGIIRIYVNMDLERQKKAPIYGALEQFKKKRVVPFDVPGHKRGRGNPELVNLLGEKCVEQDFFNKAVVLSFDSATALLHKVKYYNSFDFSGIFSMIAVSMPISCSERGIIWSNTAFAPSISSSNIQSSTSLPNL